MTFIEKNDNGSTTFEIGKRTQKGVLFTVTTAALSVATTTTTIKVKERANCCSFNSIIEKYMYIYIHTHTLKYTYLYKNIFKDKLGVCKLDYSLRGNRSANSSHTFLYNHHIKAPEEGTCCMSSLLDVYVLAGWLGFCRNAFWPLHCYTTTIAIVTNRNNRECRSKMKLLSKE